MGEEECKKFADKGDKKFSKESSSSYAPGCVFNSRWNSVVYNKKKASTTKCGGSFKYNCVCGKPEEEKEDDKEEFKITEKGVCGKSVSRKICQNEASKDGRTVKDSNSKYAPKGCFFDNGMVEYYYNSAESSAQCTSDSKCYCVVEEEKEEFKITEKGVCGKFVSRNTCQNEASKDGRTVKDANSKYAPKG